MPHASSSKSRLVSLLGSIVLIALSARGAAAAGPRVYVLTQVNGGPNQIYGFTIDQATGILIPLGGFPVASGGTGTAATYSQHIAFLNNRLYVVNDGDNTLSAFTVNRTSGALTPMPFSPMPLGIGSWGCVAVHPSGSPVVVGDGNGNIASFVVTASTATAAPGSPYSAGGAAPFGCTFSQDGAYVYAGGNSGAAIAGFSVNSGSGMLTALGGSPFNSGGPNPVAYATDASGRIFAVNADANTVRAFTTTSGVPTAAAGNPFTAGGLATGVHGVLHPAGFYMVADRSSRVGVYMISGSGSATTMANVSGSPFATGGSFTDAIALTPNGAFLVAANGNSRNLTVFGVNAGTGSLSTVLVQPVDTLGLAGRLTGLAMSPANAGTAAGDFDGDAKSDLTVFRSSTGGWYDLKSSTSYTSSGAAIWGTVGDVVVPGDYDGDGKIDPAVFRPSTNGWYFLMSSTNYTTSGAVIWGTSGDTAVPGDYDGDGKTDPAVFRPSTGGWYFLKSSTNYTSSGAVIWGTSGDIPVQGDYDADGKTDPAVFRPGTGTWYFLNSTTNYTTSATVVWGTSGDVTVPGDYDGDGKTDPAVFRPGTGGWYFLNSSTNYTTSGAVVWGVGTDTPVPADYDGDGKIDPAVFRPGTGGWYVLKSSTSFTSSFGFVWGIGSDTPINGRP